MTVTTVAALCTGPDAPFELREVEVDSPRADEILVRLVATGVCHTDIFLKQGLKPGGEPAVLGHEGAGVVEAGRRRADALLYCCRRSRSADAVAAWVVATRWS